MHSTLPTPWQLLIVLARRNQRCSAGFELMLACPTIGLRRGNRGDGSVPMSPPGLRRRNFPKFASLRFRARSFPRHALLAAPLLGTMAAVSLLAAWRSPTR